MLVVPTLRLARGLAYDASGGRSRGVAPSEAADELAELRPERVHVVDADADAAGAPQNVSALHEILAACGAPASFAGGLERMHTCELLLGLGVSWLVIEGPLRRSRTAAAFFFSRLGDACIAAVDASGAPSRGWGCETWSPSDCASALEDAGCPRFLARGARPEVGGLAELLRRPVLADMARRNAPPSGDVRLEGEFVSLRTYRRWREGR